MNNKTHDQGLLKKVGILVGCVLALGGMSAWAFDWSAVTPGGEVVVPADTDAVVENDDAAKVSSLKIVTLSAATSRLVWNVSSNAVLGCSVVGAGKIVKRQESILEFAPICDVTIRAKEAGFWANHYTDGGIVIEEGVVKAPQGSGMGKFGYGPVELVGRSAFYLVDDNDTYVQGLNGTNEESVVTTTATTENVLRIGKSGGDSESRYAGVVSGSTAINVYGNQTLTGRSSTFTGKLVVTSRFTSSTRYEGFASIAKIGKKGEPSSVGVSEKSVDVASGAGFGHVGSEDDETDKPFSFRVNSDVPMLVDGGCGGVTFLGKWTAVGAGKTGEIWLDGTNTDNACVFDNEIDFTPTSGDKECEINFIKKGSGVWRFNDNAERKNGGVLVVEDGTVQFESIAPKGIVCSLGTSEQWYRGINADRTEEHRVDYAFLLGGSGSPVFEFVGVNDSLCADRPVALRGTGATIRANGTGVLDLSGVDIAKNGGDVTLVLDGTNTAGCTLREVTDNDSAGKLSVVKRGAGVWRLAGNQTFRGAMKAEAGTLVLRKNPFYRWYRFTITGQTQIANLRCLIRELAFYDVHGNRQDLGIVCDLPSEPMKDGSKYYHSVDYRALLPGHAVVSEGLNYLGTSTERFESTEYIDKLFDDANASWRCNTYETSGNASLVVRFADSANEIRAFDICYYKAASANMTACRLEASTDGEDWTVLTNVTDFANAATGCWTAQNEEFVPGAVRPGKGYPIAGHVSESVSQFDSVDSLAVAPGATLAGEGDMELSELTLDVSGVKDGVIRGIRFAKDGVIHLTGPLPSGGVVLPYVFENVDGLDSLANWKLKRAGTNRDCGTLKVEDGRLVACANGLILLFR